MTPKTLRKERRKKFYEIINGSNIGKSAEARYESYGNEAFDRDLLVLVDALVDAAESRSERAAERKTDETQGDYVAAADKKVDAILGFAKLEGKWKGRENTPPYLLGYADWWNEKTGQEFPGKVKNDYLKEWAQWNSDQITRAALDEAFAYEDGWRRKQGGKVSHPRELTKSAFGFNANPKQKNPGTTYTDEEGIPLS